MIHLAHLHMPPLWTFAPTLYDGKVCAGVLTPLVWTRASSFGIPLFKLPVVFPSATAGEIVGGGQHKQPRLHEDEDGDGMMATAPAHLRSASARCAVILCGI